VPRTPRAITPDVEVELYDYLFSSTPAAASCHSRNSLLGTTSSPRRGGQQQAMALLTESPENAVPLLKDGSLEPLMNILHEAGTDPTQWWGQTASWCVGFLMNVAQFDDVVAALLQEGVVDLLATFVSWSLPEPQGCHGCYLRLPVRHGRQDLQSPSSIRTERTTGLTDYCNDENEGGHNTNNITDIDTNETADEIETSQRRRVVDKEPMLHDSTKVYGGIDPPPPPLPSTSIPSSSSSSSSSSENKNLKEYLSQFRQLSKSERRKLLSEVKNILDVGDKSMIGGVDDGRNYYYARKMSDEMQQEEEDDSLLASSGDDGTAMDSRVSSYYSDTSTAFYTNDVSTARTSMYNTAESNYTSDDDNNRARYERSMQGEKEDVVVELVSEESERQLHVYLRESERLTIQDCTKT